MARPYQSPARDLQAAQTRQQILASAATLFAERGYSATSMRQLAGAAGVSVTTLYAIGSKAHLFRQALDHVLNGTDDGTHLLDQAAMMENLESSPTLQEHLWVTAGVLTASNQRGARLWAAFLEGSATDPELAEAYQSEADDMRADATRSIRRIIDLGICPEPDDLARTVDLIWAAAHPVNYSLLVNHAGWSPEEFRQWLYERWLSLLEK